jgi:hypothetical protein
MARLRELYNATGWEANGAAVPRAEFPEFYESRGEPACLLSCVEGCRIIGIYPWGKRGGTEEENIRDAEDAARALADLLNFVEEVVEGR